MKKLIFALCFVGIAAFATSCATCHKCTGATYTSINGEWCPDDCVGCGGNQTLIDAYMSGQESTCTSYGGTWE